MDKPRQVTASKFGSSDSQHHLENLSNILHSSKLTFFSKRIVKSLQPKTKAR